MPLARRSLSTTTCLLLALAFAQLACPSLPDDDAGALDAGEFDDAGTHDDGGVSGDAGSSDDAGESDDAGHSHDAGDIDDAGAINDAGHTDDAGVDDAGALVDGGAVDAGEPVDAGPVACTVANTPGTCTDVNACDGVSWLGTCDGAPAVQCCADVLAVCSVDGAPGACVDVGTCGAPLVATPGKCPGPANIQCCTDPQSACVDGDAPLLNAALPGGGLVEPTLDPACPAGMLSAGAFCIDAVEASLVVVDDEGTPLMTHSPFAHPTSDLVRAMSIPGAVPQAYIDGDRAAVACENAGKRLCTDAEWLSACRGPSNFTYPYGDTRVDGACNDARSPHPAIEYFGTADAWIWSELGNSCIAQLPNGLAPTGTHVGCESAHGAFDMMGNLHEWTADPNGTFRGGFYVDTVLNGNGCLYATTAHTTPHWDYSTGFRCCF